VTRLRDELERVQSVVRQIETEVVGMHDQVRRWMRRAVAAERAVVRNQEPAVSLPHVNGHATPAPRTPSTISRLSLRGARARIAARRRLEADAEVLREVSEGAPSTHALPVDVSVPPEGETEGD